MKSFLKYTLIGAVLSLSALSATAADLTISLTGSDPITRHTVKFQCDGHAGTLGLPTGVFPVEYLNGNGNSLAVLPIKGHSLIFANVMSGSGARYAADQYVWWDAGARGIHLYANPDSLSGKDQTSCQPVK
ncbi:MAG: MliC family protein [Acidobacteriaceae bacterium]|nr:MliC family protein [Acidobacteriaceae bacterium]MBV9678112.1 MliC family protein [Acidobacteriaceae bacterium]